MNKICNFYNRTIKQKGTIPRMLRNSVKSLAAIAVVGALSVAAIGANAQSDDVPIGQGEIFLPFVSNELPESEPYLPGEDPYSGLDVVDEIQESNSEPMVQAAQVMAQAGGVTSTSIELGTDISLDKLEPADWSLSSEKKYTRRLLLRMLNRYDYMPDSMAFSVSNTDSATPTMFVAATLGKADIKWTQVGGLLIQSELNATNQFEVVAQQVFPECKELDGVQSSRDGSLVAVLCKSFNTQGQTGDNGITKDLVASHGADHNNQFTLPDNSDYDMWLYEWIGTNGQPADITTDPTYKFIVHTSLDFKEPGLPHSFVYAENDPNFPANVNNNTYAISISQAAANGHTNDSLYIVSRANDPQDYRIELMHRGMSNNGLRGWKNSCGSGHPFLVNLGFNPAIDQYSVLCTTEANNTGAGNDIAGINFARGKIIKDNPNEQPNFLLLQRDGANRMKGGGGALLPLGNGWIGIAIGADVERTALNGGSASPATQVGLVQFDDMGVVIAQPDQDPSTATVGEALHWVETPAQYANHYVSYPQLVPLDAANDKYLLGYGIMPARGDTDTNFGGLHWKLTLPMKYFVQEIKIECGDAACMTPATITPLTDPKELNGVGWGMIDQMVPLGTGQVGWATYEMNRMTLPLGAGQWTQPNAFTKKIQFNVYDSTLDAQAQNGADIQIRARGREGSEKMELRVADQVVREWTVTTSWASYNYTHPTEVSANQISIHFTNDWRKPAENFDRNLYVDKMILNGTTYESEAATVTGKGPWDGSSCRTVAAHRKQGMVCNGYFLYQ